MSWPSSRFLDIFKISETRGYGMDYFTRLGQLGNDSSRSGYRRMSFRA
jgi:hypothetical protein